MANIQPDFLLFVKALHHLFKPAQLNRWARETKFTQKNSKFTGILLVSLCSFLSPTFGTDTLVAYTTCLERTVQLSISPQALHDRFDHTAVALLEKVLHECLKERSWDISPNKKSRYQLIRLIGIWIIFLYDGFTI